MMIATLTVMTARVMMIRANKSPLIQTNDCHRPFPPQTSLTICIYVATCSTFQAWLPLDFR